MKKQVYDAMLRLCVDSFHDINWKWDDLTTSERIAIGSRDIFDQIKAAAADFLVVKPSFHFEAKLMRCDRTYAQSHPDDVSWWTSVTESGDYHVSNMCEWAIFKMNGKGAQFDEMIELDFYYTDKAKALEKVQEMNRSQLQSSAEIINDCYHVVLIECCPEFEQSFPKFVDPVWTKVEPDLQPLWTIFREPYYAKDKIEWVSLNVFFDSISVAHDSLFQLKHQLNQSHGS